MRRRTTLPCLTLGKGRGKGRGKACLTSIPAPSPLPGQGQATAQAVAALPQAVVVLALVPVRSLPLLWRFPPATSRSTSGPPTSCVHRLRSAPACAWQRSALTRTSPSARESTPHRTASPWVALPSAACPLEASQCLRLRLRLRLGLQMVPKLKRKPMVEVLRTSSSSSRERRYTVLQATKRQLPKEAALPLLR